MNLSCEDNIHYGVKIAHLKFGTSFFNGFPGGTLACSLANFKKTGGQRPKAITWLNVAAAQENFIFPQGQCADNVDGIDILDGVAGRAYGTQPRVTRRDAMLDSMPALAAVVDDGCVRHDCSLARIGKNYTASVACLQGQYTRT